MCWLIDAMEVSFLKHHVQNLYAMHMKNVQRAKFSINEDTAKYRIKRLIKENIVVTHPA